MPDAVDAAQPTPASQASKPGQPAKRAGQMYKWVDENGVTHYGQTIPPEYRDQAAEEMNRRGMTVRRIEPAGTPEERRAAGREAGAREGRAEASSRNSGAGTGRW